MNLKIWSRMSNALPIHRHVLRASDSSLNATYTMANTRPRNCCHIFEHYKVAINPYGALH